MMSPSSDIDAEHISKSSLAFTHDLSMWLLDNAVKNSRIDVISKTLSLVKSWNKVKNKIASDNQNTKKNQSLKTLFVQSCLRGGFWRVSTHEGLLITII